MFGLMGRLVILDSADRGSQFQAVLNELACMLIFCRRAFFVVTANMIDICGQAISKRSIITLHLYHFAEIANFFV